MIDWNHWIIKIWTIEQQYYSWNCQSGEQRDSNQKFNGGRIKDLRRGHLPWACVPCCRVIIHRTKIDKFGMGWDYESWCYTRMTWKFVIIGRQFSGFPLLSRTESRCAAAAQGTNSRQLVATSRALPALTKVTDKEVGKIGFSDWKTRDEFFEIFFYNFTTLNISNEGCFEKNK